MRTPSSQKCRLDVAPPWADRFILGITPSITARCFSAGPSDSTSRWTPCPPKYSKRRLQVGLGCIRLSPSCPFRLLHTFRFSPASEAVNPASWIWRPSSERQRDFNPPEQRAAQRAPPVSRPAILDGESHQFSRSKSLSGFGRRQRISDNRQGWSAPEAQQNIAVA
jgi:hypothetical protein